VSHSTPDQFSESGQVRREGAKPDAISALSRCAANVADRVDIHVTNVSLLFVARQAGKGAARVVIEASSSVAQQKSYKVIRLGCKSRVAAYSADQSGGLALMVP
jgi:hypothetical protein